MNKNILQEIPALRLYQVQYHLYDAKGDLKRIEHEDFSQCEVLTEEDAKKLCTLSSALHEPPKGGKVEIHFFRLLPTFTAYPLKAGGGFEIENKKP